LSILQPEDAFLGVIDSVRCGHVLDSGLANAIAAVIG
jgi:hypothetical protein